MSQSNKSLDRTSAAQHHPSSNLVPKFYIVWLLISSLIIIYQCTFLLLRPSSMQGGQLFPYFQSFDTYIKIDPLFGDTQNWFVHVLIIFNFIELIFNMVGLIFYLAGPSKTARDSGVGLLMFTAMGSFYKTLIFLVYDFYYFMWEEGNGLNVLFVYVIPNLCWVGFPLVGMVKIYSNIVSGSFVKISEYQLNSKKEN